MEFAERGHRREELPDLPVSLLMVLRTLRLECEKLMELTVSFVVVELYGVNTIFPSTVCLILLTDFHNHASFRAGVLN